MPIVVIAIVSFLCGWAIGACFVTKFGMTENHYRVLLGFLAFLAGLIVFGITAGEADHQSWAFQFEIALVEQRWCAVLLWILAGFAIYPFREAIKGFLANLTDLALKAPPVDGAAAAGDGAPPPERRVPAQEVVPITAPRPEQAPAQRRGTEADARSSKYLPLSLPWFIEAGILGAILVAAIFALNPKMLKGLTSFKAGYIEAHFATAGPALQKGQVAVVDANRKSVFSNWNSFDIKDDARTEIYSKNPDLKIWRLEFASKYFREQLSPIFHILGKRELSYLKLSADNFEILQDFSTRLSNIIESNLDSTKIGETENTIERQVYLLKKVSQEILLFTCNTSPRDRPPECENPRAILAATCLTKASLETAGDCQNDYQVKFPDAIADIEKHYNKMPDRKAAAENIWEPYIIQAVADLLGRSMSSRERANFLEVATSFLEKGNDACDRACIFPVPGQMSLVYAAVEAKVESEQPWPFDHMFQQVSNLLSDTRRVVDAEGFKDLTRAIGRRNRLIDLSLGLQLFYQRALSGQRFTPAQMQSWSEWLKETRAALYILEDVGPGGYGYLEDSEKDAWRTARRTIERDPAIIQDAATAAALSSVLVPAQGDGTTGTDCLEARSLMDFASSRNLDNFYEAMHFDPDDKATYRGLIDQMKARVESECE